MLTMLYRNLKEIFFWWHNWHGKKKTKENRQVCLSWAMVTRDTPGLLWLVGHIIARGNSKRCSTRSTCDHFSGPKQSYLSNTWHKFGIGNPGCSSFLISWLIQSEKANPISCGALLQCLAILTATLFCNTQVWGLQNLLSRWSSWWLHWHSQLDFSQTERL